MIEGRVCAVTGGARGLGAAIAQRFADAGARGAVLDCAIVSRPPDGWVALECDVREPGSLHSAFGELARLLGTPNVVVANAGIVPPWTTAAQIDLEEWDEVFALNVRAAMLTVREAVRRMGADGGSIIAMSSLNGWKGDPHLPAYVASKHAVAGLVRSVALDVGDRGIRVNALAPGPVETEALRQRMAAREARFGIPVDEARRQAASATALKRIATITEVADAALFLASDLSSGITGHLLPVDAGML